jgi:hypothetical protein
MNTQLARALALGIAIALGASSAFPSEPPPARPPVKRPPPDRAERQPTTQDFIDSALEGIAHPVDREQETHAVWTIFGGNHLVAREHLPPAVQKFVMARGLDYRDWEARRGALNGLCGWHSVDFNIPAYIAILRDGLNDSDRRVRTRAARELRFAHFVLTGGIFGPKTESARVDYEKHREAYIDQLVELGVKALADEHQDVAINGSIYLEDKDTKPTLQRLRALERVLARKQVNEIVAESTQDLQAQWQTALRAPPRAKDK